MISYVTNYILIFPQTHWTVANTAHIAARTKLNDDHPIRKVMKIFLYNTGAINMNSTFILAQDNGLLHRMTGLTYKGFSSGLRYQNNFLPSNVVKTLKLSPFLNDIVE